MAQGEDVNLLSYQREAHLGGHASGLSVPPSGLYTPKDLFSWSVSCSARPSYSFSNIGCLVTWP